MHRLTSSGANRKNGNRRQRETADHSLPYITAVALIDGEVTDKQFEPERFTEPKIVSFLENVKVDRNDELSALYAEAVANIVHVTLADGRTLTKRVDYPLGNAKNRLADPELEGKFHSLADAKDRQGQSGSRGRDRLEARRGEGCQ